MAKLNERIAVISGVNAGVIASTLEQLMYDVNEDYLIRYDRIWCRTSMKRLSVLCPYLSVRQIEGALKELREQGIICKARFNESRFDHTNWYAFTEYGGNLLKGGETNR